MKFTDKRTPIKTVPFESIKIGECFITPSDNHLNMRVRPSYYDSDDAYNGIDLITGVQYIFESDEEVISVTAEIIVTD